ncbi:MAG: ATP-dependent DNA ligase [Candidatus Woesearchaeota archaeon]|nr:ATP-dependent DNA ligase [Candidatus Woesearchaeota archaeon]
MDYLDLVNVYEELEKTTKRLEKSDIISRLLKKASVEDLEQIMYLIQGKVFPNWDERKIGMSSKLALRAVTLATGASKEEVEKMLNKLGDLGKVAEELTKEKEQVTLVQHKLTVKKVFDNIRKLSVLEGEGTVNKKIGLVAELLTSAKPIEAKFIIRTVLEVLRVGVAEGILRDAIAKAYDVDFKEVEQAFDLMNDYSEVAKVAKKKSLGKIGLTIMRPINAMLAIRVETIEDAFKALGKPALFEYKLDGFRVQIHKKDNKILLFTRGMENVTNQFKETLNHIEKNIKGDSYVLDSEFVGYDAKTGKYLPFQNISQRIKRKYDIEDIAKRFPVEVNLFDIMYYEGKDLTKETQEQRRKFLEKIVKQVPKKIVLTKKLVTDNEKEAKKFYKESLKAGNEGVMVKNLKTIYQPGRRVGGWLKIKSIMETLDLVISGAEWGEGKRATWLSSFTLSCRKDSEFLDVGKVGTGIKEKDEEGITFKQLTKLLKPNIIKQEGKIVKIKPSLVVEIAYEEIQKSPTYSSGYALRFPRVLRVRYDKGVKDIDTIYKIKEIYSKQIK